MHDLNSEIRRAFGFLFIGVSIAVFSGSVISEVVYVNNLPAYYYMIIWMGSFGAVFGGGFPKFRKVAPMIRDRMKASVEWSTRAKLVNAICWSGPFVAIAPFPSWYQYLILLGIGLGNLSTWVLTRNYNAADNREQLLVAVISLIAIPIAIAIDSSFFAANQDIAVMLSRILIAIAYAAGGAYALSRRTEPPHERIQT